VNSDEIGEGQNRSAEEYEALTRRVKQRLLAVLDKWAAEEQIRAMEQLPVEPVEFVGPRSAPGGSSPDRGICRPAPDASAGGGTVAGPLPKDRMAKTGMDGLGLSPRGTKLQPGSLVR
jgi:hypothetical protein